MIVLVLGILGFIFIGVVLYSVKGNGDRLPFEHFRSSEGDE